MSACVTTEKKTALVTGIDYTDDQVLFPFIDIHFKFLTGGLNALMDNIFTGIYFFRYPLSR